MLKQKQIRHDRIANVGDGDETIIHLMCKCNKLMKKSIRLDIFGWGRWSTGNCSKNWNLAILSNGICINENLP